MSTGIDSPVRADWSTARPAGEDRAVDRHPLAGPDDDDVADDHLRRRDLDLAPVAADPGGPGGLVEQSVDRASGSVAKVTASSTSPTRAMKTTSAATNGWPITSAARHAWASAMSAPIRPWARASSAP